jgi:cytochrome c oxidase subunit 2
VSGTGSWLTAPASVQAGALAEVGWVLILGASAVFAFTMGLLALALRRRRRRAPRGVWWIAGLGVAFPVVLLSALLAYSVARTAGLERPDGRRPWVVSVVGHLWWWELRYHDPATGRWIATANELHLPEGQLVQLGLESADVIHSFWVPALGGKMDLVPGRVNRLLVDARVRGVHRGACAEYCGTQHARMALHVVVEPLQDFERWLAAQAQPAAPVHEPRLVAGQRAFLANGCGSCHALRGVAEGNGLGPDLTHVGSRLHLGAGTLRNDVQAMARFVTHVQEVKPGARMPSFAHLDGETVDALASYLWQSK